MSSMSKNAVHLIGREIITDLAQGLETENGHLVASWDNTGNRNLSSDLRRYHDSYKESHSPDRSRNCDRSHSKSRV